MKHLCTLLLFLCCSFGLLAQTSQKSDVVLKRNGEEMKGEVTAMEDKTIKFVYTGETLVYTIKKEEIEKIIFKSGRVETISAVAPAAPEQSSNTYSTADHRNRVAILPFAYLEDGHTAAEELGLKVQNECYALLNGHTGSYTIMDNHNTNALLIRSGISSSNIASYTMDEICNILGVEYVVGGMVTVNKTSQSNYSSQSSSSKTNDKDKSSQRNSYGSAYSTTEQQYKTTLDLKIYNDKGVNVYSQNREPFWHDRDSYKSALEYLLKRCPLYKK